MDDWGVAIFVFMICVVAAVAGLVIYLTVKDRRRSLYDGRERWPERE